MVMCINEHVKTCLEHFFSSFLIKIQPRPFKYSQKTPRFIVSNKINLACAQKICGFDKRLSVFLIIQRETREL